MRPSLLMAFEERRDSAARRDAKATAAQFADLNAACAPPGYWTLVSRDAEMSRLEASTPPSSWKAGLVPFPADGFPDRSPQYTI
jgi:hypothetical protein